MYIYIYNEILSHKIVKCIYIYIYINLHIFICIYKTHVYTIKSQMDKEDNFF